MIELTPSVAEEVWPKLTGNEIKECNWFDCGKPVVGIGLFPGIAVTAIGYLCQEHLDRHLSYKEDPEGGW